MTISGHWPRVVMAEDELIRLVQNFVSNGLKFVEKGHAPDIKITSTLNSFEWVLQVKDNGIGIEPHQIDRLFKIFTRLNNREDYPGTGIGLAICKKIAERFNGTVACYSEGLGKGTTFEARFPRQGVI